MKRPVGNGLFVWVNMLQDTFRPETSKPISHQRRECEGRLALWGRHAPQSGQRQGWGGGQGLDTSATPNNPSRGINTDRCSSAVRAEVGKALPWQMASCLSLQLTQRHSTDMADWAKSSHLSWQQDLELQRPPKITQPLPANTCWSLERAALSSSPPNSALITSLPCKEFIYFFFLTKTHIRLRIRFQMPSYYLNMLQIMAKNYNWRFLIKLYIILEKFVLEITASSFI